MAAWDITVLDTLDLLDGPLHEFAEGVADDRYAIWLGAGVSMGRLPGLEGVVEAVLEHVRCRVDPTSEACAFRVSLNEILALVTLDDTQRGMLDYGVPVANWPPIELIKRQLVDRYSVMLEQFPATELPDYLVWNGVMDALCLRLRDGANQADRSVAVAVNSPMFSIAFDRTGLLGTNRFASPRCLPSRPLRKV